MNEVIVLKKLLSVPRWVLFHGIGVLDDFLHLLNWCLFFLASCTSKGSLIVERHLGLFLLRGMLGAIELWESSKHWEAERWRWHAHHTSLVVRSDAVGTMHHATCDCLLLLII